jgi:two-component system, NarL family, invasion response regulator UvrY
LIRLLLVDDHSIVREGLRRILSSCSDIQVTGEAASGKDAISLALSKEFDAVLLDIGLPDRNGVDVYNELKQKRPSLPVIFISMYPEEMYARRLLEIGAAGYVEKTARPDELIGAVRKIAQGHTYVSESLAETLVGRGGSARPAQLTSRELEVLRLIAGGKSVKETAFQLGISIQTVSTHRANAFRKLNLETNTEFIRYALLNGII